MYICNKAPNFDGVDGVETEGSFNDLINALDRLILNENITDTDFQLKLKELKFKLLKLSYYDVVNREVHVRLGYKELATYTTALLSFLPNFIFNYFDDRMISDDVKIYRPRRNEDDAITIGDILEDKS